MHEYVTQAFVLAVKPYRGEDRMIELFTKELGRLGARLVGGRRMLSKVAPHLNPWDLTLVRLVRKRSFTVADAIVTERRKPLRKNRRGFFVSLEMLFAVRALTPVLAPDFRLWYFLDHRRYNNLSARRENHSGASELSELLRVLGYDPSFATCSGCGAEQVAAFVLADQEFVCARCATKFERNALLSIA